MDFYGISITTTAWEYSKSILKQKQIASDLLKQMVFFIMTMYHLISKTKSRTYAVVVMNSKFAKKSVSRVTDVFTWIIFQKNYTFILIRKALLASCISPLEFFTTESIPAIFY